MDTVTVAAVLLPTLAIILTMRGSLRRRSLALDLAMALFAAVISGWAGALSLEYDRDITLFAILVVRLAVWFYNALSVSERVCELRWSAWRLGLIALSFHAITVSQVLTVPIDGDEPYYVLMTESLVHDRDLDLTNQYASLERSVTSRPDLRPQPGDPVTDAGEQRSRHEPFLAFLLVPGFLAGGLAGASGVIVLFAGLLCWSVVRLLEDVGFDPPSVVAGTAFVVLTAPLVSYSTRIWPEIPAAFLLSEALRWGLRGRLIPSALLLVVMSLLKLRLALIAAPLIVMLAWRTADRARRRWILAVALLALGLPMTIAFLQSGSVMNVHRADELLLLTPEAIARGIFGMLLDGQSGLLFVCPVLFLSILAVIRHGPGWEGAGTVWLCVLPYVIMLAPRAEWHGGWSPPLRYLVVFAPLGALVVARATHSWRLSSWMALAWAGSLAVTVSAVAKPWKQFHIANGESVLGELLSNRWGSDFSRLVPSFIRVNDAAVWAALTLVLIMIAARLLERGRSLSRLGVPILSLSLVVLFLLGRQPGRVIHFEDAHVAKSGGELDPHRYTIARFLYDGAWRLRPGEEVRFLAPTGMGVLRYRSDEDSRLVMNGQPLSLPRSPGWRSVRLAPSTRRGANVLRVVEGEIVLESLRVR